MMAMSTAKTPVLSMKLLIDTTARRVLFAEANKAVVDFLFSLLSLPIATAVRLIGSGSMVGSAGNLYKSVVKIDGAYVLCKDDLQALLNPTVISPAAASNISLLRLPDPSPRGFFRCGDCHSPGYVTDERGTECPRCGARMKDAIKCVRSADSGGSRQAATRGGAKGCVQGIVTYTVTDSLTVTPMSSISSMILLNTLGVRDYGALQEKTVWLGYSEGLAILKASLQSKTALADVFLSKKRKAPY